MTPKQVLCDLCGLLVLLFAVLFLMGCESRGSLTGPSKSPLADRYGVVCSKKPLVVIYCEDDTPCVCPGHGQMEDFPWGD